MTLQNTYFLYSSVALFSGRGILPLAYGVLAERRCPERRSMACAASHEEHRSLPILPIALPPLHPTHSHGMLLSVPSFSVSSFCRVTDIPSSGAYGRRYSACG